MQARTSCSAVAHVEAGWLQRLQIGTLYRYEMPVESFEDMQDAGMWVSRTTVLPMQMVTLTSLDRSLVAAGFELRVLDRLTALRPVWDSTLHASGIRLRKCRELDIEPISTRQPGDVT